MKKIGLFLGILFIAGLSGITLWWIGKKSDKVSVKSPIEIIKLRPLDKYTIENLANTKAQKGKIKYEKILEKEKDYTSHLFTFEFNPNLDGKTLKKTTGQINIPAGEGPFPLVLMLRGYIDQELYKTGDGTRRAAEFFAKDGFITVAPDFLGYGESGPEAENIFEARFQTYTAVLSLLESSAQIEKWNSQDIFIWGHSNGGQIALTVLEITENEYPATLWAPVSKPFPYSILYYTDDAEDRGKLIRYELAKFEKLYDPDLYAIDIYFNRINSPLQIHQGTADDAVPTTWSDELEAKLSSLPVAGLNLDYYKYVGANHNMVPIWNTVVARDLEFFKKHLKDN